MKMKLKLVTVVPKPSPLYCWRNLGVRGARNAVGNTRPEECRVRSGRDFVQFQPQSIETLVTLAGEQGR